MSKDGQLYQRAAKTAKASIDYNASKTIRALLSACNRKDRELADWREGRAHKALEAEIRYLRRMIQQRKERNVG